MATFGKTTDGANVTTASIDGKSVSSGTPASSGVATKLTLRTWLSAGITTAKGVIYSDNAGAPDALLATSDEVTVSNTSEAEVDFPLSGGNQISVVSGTPYWIGILYKDPGTATYSISRANTANLTKGNADTYSDGPSDPFGSPTNSNGALDCYVTYTEATDPALLAGTFAPVTMPVSTREIVGY
jgi:hypothetical protein